MAIHLSPRARQALRIAGYVLLGFVTFVYALHYTFPYDRIEGKVKEALASKYEVTIGEIERSPIVPGRFAIKSLTLRSRPSVVGQPVTTMFFKRVEIDVAFLPLLGGKAEIGLDVSTGNGHITGTIKASKASLAVDLTLRKVPLAMLPGISDAVGLPLGGPGDGHVRLTLPKGDWTKATGNIKLSCTAGCTVGDEGSRVYPKAKREADQLMLKDGVPVAQVRVARFVLGLRIAKGEAKKEIFEFESPDGDIELDFNIKLAKRWNDSSITGCIRYKCADEYQRKAPAACDLGSPVIDKDGFHNIKLTGKFATMKRLGAVCDAGGGGDDDGPDAFSGGGIDKGRRDRPTLDRVESATTDAAGVGAATSPVPPVEMGRPMPMADDINPRIDAATPDVGGTRDGNPNPGAPTGPGQGTVAPMPGTTGGTGTPEGFVPPPPPVPGTEIPQGGEPPVIQPEGDPQHDGTTGNGTTGGGATGNGGIK